MALNTQSPGVQSFSVSGPRLSEFRVLGTRLSGFRVYRVLGLRNLEVTVS